MVQNLIAILFSIFFSFPAHAVMTCGKDAKLDAFGMIENLSVDSCERTKSSPTCKKLYEEIKNEGDISGKKELNCSKSGIRSLGSIMTGAEYVVGCSFGGVSFIADTLKGLGEGAAKAYIDYEDDKADSAKCDKDSSRKRAFYTDYNAKVPELLRVEVPKDEVLLQVDCKRLQVSLHMNQRRQIKLAMDKVRGRISNPESKYDSKEQEYVDWIKKMNTPKGDGNGALIAAAKDYLKNTGIKLECYNNVEAAALVCEAAAVVATTVSGLGGAAIKVARTSRIAQIAGISKKTTLLTTETAAAASVDAEKMAKAADASKALNRPVTRPDQIDAVYDAHKVGEAEGKGFRVTQGGADDEYNFGDLRNKARKMQAADFDQADRRILMESRTTGSVSKVKSETSFIQEMNNGMSRGNKEFTKGAYVQGKKYYKVSDKSEAEFKKIYPENQGTGNLIQANYSGLSTDEAASAVNKYLEVYKYDVQKDKLAVISHLRRESEYFEKQAASRSPGVDPNIANYRVYKNKELEYKLITEYYESRAKLVDKYNQLDIDKLSLGQKKSLATLEKDLEALRALARRNGWPND